MIELLIGGDLCPINRNLPFFQNGNVHDLFPDHIDMFRDSNLFMLNLECPLTDENEATINKIGPALRVPENCIQGIVDIDVGLLTLANNHILDFGEKGLEDTLKTSFLNGMPTVGAGKDLATANGYYSCEINGVQIGVYAIADNEFSVADRYKGGANPVDLTKLPQKLIEITSKVDYLVVLLHQGVEGYQYPSPGLCDLSHLIVDLGARAVVCQHSHCVGGYENYNDALIVYGQGNFLFDYFPDNRDISPWNEGIFVKLNIDEKTFEHKHSFHPYVQSLDHPGIAKMSPEKEEIFLNKFVERSEHILDAAKLNKVWVDYCNSITPRILGKLITSNRYFLRLNDMLRIDQRIFSGTKNLLLQNLIRCGDHREILQTIFKLNESNQSK